MEESSRLNKDLPSVDQPLTASTEALQSMAQEEPAVLNGELQDRVNGLTSVNSELANLLLSVDIPIVVLDADLRIKRFTAAASPVLNLRLSDTGRPMSHLASTLFDVDLSQDARMVLATGSPLEKEVRAHGGGRYHLRVLPYRAEHDVIEGVVLSLADVTALKQTEENLRAARERIAGQLGRMTRLHTLGAELMARGDVHLLLEHVLHAARDITAADMANIQILDEAGTLAVAAHVGFEAPFLDFFARVVTHTDSACDPALAVPRRVVAEDVTTSAMFAGQPSLPVLLRAGVRALQCTPLIDRAGRVLGVFSTHYRGVHHFDEAELRWLDLLAGHAADIIERDRVDERLAQAHRELEARVASRTRSLSVMHDVARAINEAATWDDALRRVIRRLCETGQWQVGFVYVPQPGEPVRIVPVASFYTDERFHEFHEASMRATYAPGEHLPGRVFAAKETIWIVDTETLALPKRTAAALTAGFRAVVALPVVIQKDVLAVLELFSDQVHETDDQLTTLMFDVGDQIGRVLERERATARTADLVWREQQALLHTLHDSLGQTLTALGFLSTGLRGRMETADPEASRTAEEIAHQARCALDQVRQLAKSLFPVEVDAESLIAALSDLASATEALHRIRVRVEGDGPGLRDGKIATELYRIAQEAVNNAVKHARAATIAICLHADGALTELQVTDDGIGIQQDEASHGMGLQIMRHRAASIGASLRIERAAGGGTVVTCTLHEPPGDSYRRAAEPAATEYRS